MAVIWTIWSHRIGILFNGKKANLEQVVDLVKFRSWKWLQCRKKGFIYSSYDWECNPSGCLGLNHKSTTGRFELGPFCLLKIRSAISLVPVSW